MRRASNLALPAPLVYAGLYPPPGLAWFHRLQESPKGEGQKTQWWAMPTFAAPRDAHHSHPAHPHSSPARRSNPMARVSSLLSLCLMLMAMLIGTAHGQARDAPHHAEHAQRCVMAETERTDVEACRMDAPRAALACFALVPRTLQPLVLPTRSPALGHAASHATPALC